MFSHLHTRPTTHARMAGTHTKMKERKRIYLAVGNNTRIDSARLL